MSLVDKNIVVVGGGISGMSVAVEAAEVGYPVVLIEREPYLGGRISRMNQYFPKLCPPYCGMEINFKRIKANPRIEVYTQTELASVSGSAGNYAVTLTKKPRFVNENCTACGECAKVCPVERDSDFDYGLSKTKAIYLPHPMAYPHWYVIDPLVCKGKECGKCVKACKYNAINLDDKPETIDVPAGAIVLATGWKPYDATRMDNLGFGKYKNVITNVMMERLASVNGPTEGKILKPSDGKEAKRVVFVQCAGSRDENHLPFCSAVCCLASLKQATYVRQQYPDSSVKIFYIDIRAGGRLEAFYTKVAVDEGIKLVKGKVAKIAEKPDGSLVVTAEDTLTGNKIEEEADLVVLATGMQPEGINPKIVSGLQVDQYGFVLPAGGILSAGCSKKPMDVASSVQDATGVALKAIQSVRGGSNG